MLIMASKRKDGGALVVVGLPSRSQEFLRKGQPALLEGSTLAQADSIRDIALKDTDVVIAFGDSDNAIRAQLGEHSLAPIVDAVPALDRLRDLRAMLTDLMADVGSIARGQLYRAVESLEAAEKVMGG